MKKLLLILPVVALAACNQEPKTLVSGCEKIGSDEMSTTYKCPMTEELAAIQAMEANAMFKSDSGIDVVAVAADAENVYVNVAVEDKCETEGQVAYRVMVKNPTIDGKAMYAVAVCK
jgi:hypothetical protein